MGLSDRPFLDKARESGANPGSFSSYLDLPGISSFSARLQTVSKGLLFIQRRNDSMDDQRNTAGIKSKIESLKSDTDILGKQIDVDPNCDEKHAISWFIDQFSQTICAQLRTPV